MKIYTRQGDDGGSSLFGGQKVNKGDIRLEAYGTLDELSACLGWLGACEELNGEDRTWLQGVQSTLLDMGAHLATPADAPDNIRGKLPLIDQTATEALEHAIDRWQERLPALNSFILPGGTEGASRAHMARTICRRAERCTATAAQGGELHGAILPFINRLSDALFVFARLLNHRQGVEDIPWSPSAPS